jgi:hypothetical protein
MIKPFIPRELVLRVKAVLSALSRSRLPRARLCGRRTSRSILRGTGGLPRQENRADADGIQAAQHAGLPPRARAVAGDAVERRLGDRADITTRTIDTHVKRLRQKLGPCGEKIDTIRASATGSSEDSPEKLKHPDPMERLPRLSPESPLPAQGFFPAFFFRKEQALLNDVEWVVLYGILTAAGALIVKRMLSRQMHTLIKYAAPDGKTLRSTPKRARCPSKFWCVRLRETAGGLGERLEVSRVPPGHAGSHSVAACPRAYWRWIPV